MRKFLVIACLLIHILLDGQPADNFLFRMLDTGSGLPDNNVRNMIMLPDGLMCIQTSTMLNLYDGASCKSYRYNPIEIPYTEYSGLNNSYYDKNENLIWCTSRDHIWIFDLNRHSFEYDPDSRFRKYGLDDGKIINLFIDKNNDFWVVTENNHLWKCPAEGHKAERIEMLADMTAPILMSQYGNSIWMLSINGTLAEYDLSMGCFRNLVYVFDGKEKESSRMDMVITSEGNIWVMYDRILAYYDISSLELKIMSGIISGEKNLYTTIAIDASDNLWVGSARSGVSIIDGKTMKSKTLPYLQQTNGKKIYHHTDISKIYVDNRGGVWVATLAEGLLYWHKDIYHLYTVNAASISSGGMPDEGVKCMVEDRDGTVLVGTINGLLRYNPSTNSMSVPFPELEKELCISLYRDSRDRIWLGTFYNGAYCIDNGQIRHFRFPETSDAELSYYTEKPNLNCVRCFFEDDYGNFWISVYGGIGRFDQKTGNLNLLREKHPELSRFMIIRDICKYDDNTLLISGDNGRFIYSPAEDSIYEEHHSVRCHMQSNQAFRDDRSLLWIATSDGLEITDLNTGKNYSIGAKNGLPNDNIISITADNLGNIWAATFNSISRIRAIQHGEGYLFSISNFHEEDGVTAGAFFQNSILKHSSGAIYFGGAHGFTIARPEKLYQESFDISPQISELLVSGKETDFSGERHLDFRHDESSVTFTFSNMNYINPTHTSYRYRLENFDRTWTEIHSQGLGRATYTYLKPGDYTFQVYAADNGTDWSSEPAEISFTIHPPFWKTTVAYIFYLISISGIITYGLSVYLNRKKLRQKEQLDQMKFRFFTNISHELRTPLSLIILPLESLMKELKGSSFMPKLETMHNNATELLSLVNNLLDFRKLEIGGEKLHPVLGDIVEFTDNITAFFRDAAAKKGITIESESTLKNPMMAFDRSKMSRIINNILSNAMKFTPQGGHINICISSVGIDGKEMLQIEISDTGIGIPKEDLTHIFERFYQSDNASMATGSGIGLSLVKQYAELHHGSVSVSSELGQGTKFSIRIPMDLNIEESPSQEIAGSPYAHRDTPETSMEKRYTVMVVDDNTDFRNYIASELSRSYNVIEAPDGESCLRKLKESEPDVLICDVMMPRMDGFEVTKKIKTNIETSHIPIILLTARTSYDIRLEGYETGADAYMTKPFKMDILEARIRNLIESRQRRISTFSQELEIRPSAVTKTSLDEKLMSKIMESIEKNMDNAEYSVEELSSDVNMHRMNLYRKLQSFVGMTPSEFIRTVRLKRAAQIVLERPDISLGELSDLVGFNTPKYLNKYFKEMFGCTPSQYRSQQTAGDK